MADDEIVHYNHATWVANRVQAAQAMQVVPTQNVTLPGAMAPVSVSKVNAYLKSGMDAGGIVGRVNDRWRADNADRLAAQEAWAQGPYRKALDLLAQQRAEQAALELQRRARFEELTRQRDA